MCNISVIMPVFNSEKTVAKSIDTVLNQTYKDFEFIIVDDSSRDESKNIISSFKEKDSRIVYVENAENIGVSKTRNKAIAMAKGQYIAFIDSDDMWKPEKLEKQIALMQSNQNIVLSYTSSAYTDIYNNNYGFILHAKEKTLFKTLLKKNLISCSSVMIKTSVMNEIEMPSDKMHEDYYVWLKVLKKYGSAVGIDEPLLIYRLSNNSKSSNRLKSAKMTFNTYHAFGFNKFKAMLLTMRYFFYSVKKRYRIKKSLEK